MLTPEEISKLEDEVNRLPIRRPINDAEKALVEALRSGKYIQARKALRVGKGFCCLGVACDVYDPDKWYGNGYGVRRDDLHHTSLPREVKIRLGWASAFGDLVTSALNIGRYSWACDSELDLATMNDSGVPFSIIATIIEKGYVWLLARN